MRIFNILYTLMTKFSFYDLQYFKIYQYTIDLLNEGSLKGSVQYTDI